jgi:3-hydroxymyristoyl/3-hydroxydecanoyl-(acyl carrier protein) dehydratase
LTGSEWIEGDALEGPIPHRGVNILIDSVKVVSDDESERGESRLCLAPDDARGRDIFLRGSVEGGPVIMEPVFAEHLALSAICVIRPDMAPGEIAFFSVISSFKLAREIRAGERISAEAVRLRDKGRFRRFHGIVRGEDGSTAAETDIMAYTAAPAPSAERRDSGKLAAPPESGETRPVDPAAFGWKRPEMVFVHERTHLSPDMVQAVLRYVYPPDHPFCPGHFPGNPVMMGITQWIAGLDAAAWLLFERAEAGLAAAGPSRWKADVDILRESGALVAEVKGLVFSGDVTPDGIGPLRVEGTRRVGFRDQVRPGEAIFMRARVAPVE